MYSLVAEEEEPTLRLYSDGKLVEKTFPTSWDEGTNWGGYWVANASFMWEDLPPAEISEEG